MIDYVEACTDEFTKRGQDQTAVAAEMAAWPEDQTDVIARFAQL
jgi:hypothetical protein